MMPEETYAEFRARKRKEQELAAAKPAVPRVQKMLKVGLDEWAIVRRSDDVQLMTDGLLGCIGLVLFNADYALLSHVYSDCSETNWTGSDGYEARLDHARNSIASLGALTGAVIVVSGDGYLWFRNTLKNWLGNAPVVEELTGSGMRVFATENSWEVQPKNGFQSAMYRTDRNTANSATWIVGRGTLSGNGRPFGDDS